MSLRWTGLSRRSTASCGGIGVRCWPRESVGHFEFVEWTPETVFVTRSHPSPGRKEGDLTRARQVFRDVADNRTDVGPLSQASNFRVLGNL